MLRDPGGGAPLPAGVAGPLGKGGDTGPAGVRLQPRADEEEAGRVPRVRDWPGRAMAKSRRAPAHSRDEPAEHMAGSKRGPSTLSFLWSAAARTSVKDPHQRISPILGEFVDNSHPP